MKSLVLAILALIVMVLVMADMAEAHRRFRANGHAPHHNANVGSFGFHGHVGNFGLHHGANINGFNSFASPGGRALVFVGHDRFGRPVFR